jgi:hypothetical protein
VPPLLYQANETFGPGNAGRGSFIDSRPARGRECQKLRSPKLAVLQSRASCLLLVLIVGASGAFATNGCPNSASEISADRPDVTNSSQVVPYGSLPAENGVDWTIRQGKGA